jgi:hypothetical protein
MTLEAENTRVYLAGLATFRKLVPAVRKPDTVAVNAKKMRLVSKPLYVIHLVGDGRRCPRQIKATCPWIRM